jgi:hypothetical protein
MPKMMQIRNVPDALHRKLKSRAALQGLSLSSYVLHELQKLANYPTLEELRERLASHRPIRPSVSPADMIRQERDRR